MTNIQLASKIIRGVWLMDPASAESYLPIAMNFLMGKSAANIAAGIEVAESESKETKMFAVSSLHEMKRWTSLNDAPQGSIAIIPVNGPLQKNDYCGTPGTATMASRLAQADEHPNIKGTILLIDSPGGHVDGTESFSNAIKAAKKPVMAVVDGLMASAAYWMGSSADEIYISDSTALVGSIGTMITLADFKGYYAKQGLKIHEVYASKSTDKNGIVHKVMEGDYKPIQEKLLNPINELFLSAVQTNRAGKLTNPAEVLSGEVFIGAKAIELGLADGFGGIAKAIERIEILTENQNSQSNTNMKIDMSKYPTFSALLGFGEAESTDAGLYLQESHLDALETALKTGAGFETQVGTLTGEKSELETQLSGEKGKVTSLTNEKTQLETKVTELEKAHVPAPGAAGNAADGTTGDGGAAKISEAEAVLNAMNDTLNLK
jgi:signal peptide peptidase SppA